MSLTKHYRSLWQTAIACLFSGVLIGCATPPVQAMSDARQAVAAAAQAGGDRRAPAQMQAARAALTEAEAALRDHQFKLARKNAERARGQAIAIQQLINASP